MAENLKTFAYNTIRQKITACEYAPGSFINEEILTSDLEISRTPVRDAISRLEQEGLLKILPKKGIQISELSITDINMVFEIRSIYEPYTIENYGILIPREKLEEYNEIFSRNEISRRFHDERSLFYRLDNDFHTMIMSSNTNKYMVENYKTIAGLNERYRYMTGRTSDERMIDTVAEHTSIIRACLRNEWKEAAEKMRHHLSMSKKVTFDMIFAQNKN